MIRQCFKMAAAMVLAVSFTACNQDGTVSKRAVKKIVRYAEQVYSEAHAADADAKNTAKLGKQGDACGQNAVPEEIKGLEIPAPLADKKEQILRREGYTVSYNSATRLPNWVAWQLTAAHTQGTHKRGGIKFQEDMEADSPRAVDWDYYNSGYDRGHMCPSADNKWSRKAQEQSFLFTNICPQVHNLNAGDWNEMEMQCRKWAEQWGCVYIVCGPILYKDKHKTIGKNKVVVPEAFFKVVLCMHGEPKAIGLIYKNAPGNRPKGDYVNTVDQVERITGIDFFPSLPDDIENKIEAEANWQDWM